jgi:hypothetical protein
MSLPKSVNRVRIVITLYLADEYGIENAILKNLG